MTAAPAVVHDEILSFPLREGRVLAVVDETDQSLLIYDYSAGHLIRDIPIGQKVKAELAIDDVFVNGYYVAGMDSIFALLNPHNILLLFDTSGAIRRHWKVGGTRLNGHAYGLLASLNQSPLAWRQGRMIVSQQLEGGDFAENPSRRRLKFNSPPDVELELGDDTVAVREVGTFPQIMLGDFYYDVIGARTIGPNGETVYAYGVSDSIYIWREGRPTVAVAARSAYRKVDFAPFDTARYQDVAYIKEYWATEARYGNILYDPWRRCYYRFVAHNQDFRSSDGHVNLFRDKPWSVMILDEDFRVVGEQAFVAKEYFFPNALVTEDGLLVEMSGAVTTTDDRNMVRYRVFATDLSSGEEVQRGTR